MSKHAVVIVFGDIGRSPRIMNHALFLLENSFTVHIIGYKDSELPLELATSTIHPLPSVDLSGFPTLLGIVVNLIVRTLCFCWIMLHTLKRIDLLIVQVCSF